MSNYGYCPRCGAPGVDCKRTPKGPTICANGHEYPSGERLKEPPTTALVGGSHEDIANAMLFALSMHGIVKVAGRGWTVDGHEVPTLLDALAVKLPTSERTRFPDDDTYAIARTFLRFYAKVLCVSKPGRYEVYSMLAGTQNLHGERIDGKLSDACLAVLTRADAHRKTLDRIDAACVAACGDNSAARVGDDVDPELGRYVLQDDDGEAVIDTSDPAEVVTRLSALLGAAVEAYEKRAPGDMLQIGYACTYAGETHFRERFEHLPDVVREKAFPVFRAKLA